MRKLNLRERAQRVSKKAVLYTLTLSMLLNLTGCHLFDKNKDVTPDDLVPDHSIEQMIDEEHDHEHEHTEDHEHDHEHEHEHSEDEHTEEDNKGGEEDPDEENNNEQENTEDNEVVSDFEVPNIGNYNGNSIVDALHLAGYDSSFAYRAKLAEHFGIENYRGTAAQNIQLLNILKQYAKEHPLDQRPGEEQQHQHRYSAWYSFDDEKEVRACDCGAYQTRGHSYSLTSRIYTDLGAEHQVSESYDCGTCAHVLKLTKTERHTFTGWKSLNDAQEIRTCVQDGHAEYRSHTYGAWRDNGDGTETRSCQTCTHTMTRDKEVAHEHKFVEGAPIYSNDNDVTHDVTIVSTCSCGETKTQTKTVAHSYTGWTNNGNGTESRTCKDCGHVMTRSISNPHEHTYTWVSQDDLNELGTCGCGVTTTRPHTYGSTVASYTYDETQHTKTETTGCTTCTHVKKLVLTPENHTMSPWSNNGNGTETQSCECGYSITRDIVNPHEHTYGAPEKSYTEIVGNDTQHYVTTTEKCSTCGDVHTISENVLANHSYGEWTTSADGKTESRTCADCGHVHTRNKEVSHEHTYGAPEKSYTEIEGNDTQHYVTTTEKCSTCGDVHTISENVLQNHSYGEWTTSADGKTESRTCADCGHVHTRNKEATHEHNFVEGTPVYTNKTDTTHDVTIVSTCSCGETKTDTKTGVAHKGVATGNVSYNKITDDAVNHTVVTEYKCADCEHIYTKSTTAVHHYGEQEYSYTMIEGNETQHYVTTTEKCGDCGFIHTISENVLQDHSYGDWVDNGNGTHTKTCACGHTVTEKITHEHTYEDVWTYKNEDYEHSVCTFPGCTEEKTRPHDWKIKETPTINEDGTHTITYHCDNCNRDKIQTLTEAHTGTWVNKEEAGEERTCTVCGKVETRAHSLPDTYTYNPTTKKDEKHCSTCDYVESIDHTHHFENVGSQFAVDKDGENHEIYQGQKCSVCGDTQNVLVRTESHNWSKWEEVDETYCMRSCIVDGCIRVETEEHQYGATPEITYTQVSTDSTKHIKHTKYTCEHCGHSYTIDEEVKHTYDHEEFVYNPATEMEERKCTVCGLVEQQEHKNHSFGDWTYNGDGSRTHTCSICHKDFTEDIECEHTKTTTAYNKENGKDETVCDDCKKVISSVEHTHRNLYWDYSDQVYERQLCGDDERHVVQEIAHEFEEEPFKVDYEDKTETHHTVVRKYHCKHDGCTCVREVRETVEHDFDYSVTKPWKTGSGSKYDDVWCSKTTHTCSCGLSHDIGEVAHNWTIDEDGYEYCDKCETDRKISRSKSSAVAAVSLVEEEIVKVDQQLVELDEEQTELTAGTTVVEEDAEKVVITPVIDTEEGTPTESEKTDETIPEVVESEDKGDNLTPNDEMSAPDSSDGEELSTPQGDEPKEVDVQEDRLASIQEQKEELLEMKAQLETLQQVIQEAEPVQEPAEVEEIQENVKKLIKE